LQRTLGATTFGLGNGRGRGKGYHIVGTLRLLERASPVQQHEGEVFSCAYTPDGQFVLSAGWDGVLRLWDAAAGAPLTALPASPKPLSACAAAPDGQHWLTGSMEGLLCCWDAVSHQPVQNSVAHTRPISAICFSPDGQTLATASWDRQVGLRRFGHDRDGRTTTAHDDIVSGCRFTVDGKQLVTWSYDGSVKLWELPGLRDSVTLEGHTDRVTALTLSPDGRWALSGSRDATVRLWDLDQKAEAAVVNLGTEVRGCFFLPDGESVIVADAAGRLFLMLAPSFAIQAQLKTPFRSLCGDLSPSGDQLALGGEDGLVHFVAVEGFEGASLVVNATQGLKQEATLFDRFLGKTRMKPTWNYTCPACRQGVESATLPAGPVACPRCRRPLRVSSRGPQLQRS
jgi:WD40 repeat protein